MAKVFGFVPPGYSGVVDARTGIITLTPLPDRRATGQLRFIPVTAEAARLQTPMVRLGIFRYNFFYYAYAVLAAATAAGLGQSIRNDDGLAVLVGTLLTAGIVLCQNRARIESSKPGGS